MTNEEFNEYFRNRTRQFAVLVLKFCEQLPQTPATRVVIFQLCKSATSTGANYRAFCRGRSKKEHYAKICIVVEEADESVYWLELIRDVAYDTSEELTGLLREGLEILKICAKTKSSLES